MRNRKCLFILLFALFALIFTDIAFGKEIDIYGSKEFKEQVSNALDLLRLKASDEYSTITNYIGRIEQGNKSGMWAERKPPTYEIGDRTAFYSVTWCAGTIAHDAYHSKLYHDYKLVKKGPVPSHVWKGETAEIKCLKFQLEVLKKIGAPKHEIDHCFKIRPNFFDLNNNGKYDSDDYKKRNW